MSANAEEQEKASSSIGGLTNVILGPSSTDLPGRKRALAAQQIVKAGKKRLAAAWPAPSVKSSKP